eukprot:6479260-Amphidinium_carterae.1
MRSRLEVQTSFEIGRDGRMLIPPLTMVQGAGRCRVHSDAVAATAQGMILTDLSSLGLRWEEKLISHVIHHDRKCTLACFQAKTQAQRIEAFIAALLRMGLYEYGKLLQDKCSTNTAERTDGILDSGEGAAGEDSASSHAAHAGSGSTGAFSRPTHLSKQHSEAPWTPVMRAMGDKISALETWAHALDSVSCEDDARSAKSMVRAGELIEAIYQRVASDMAKEKADDIRETLDNQAKQIQHLNNALSQTQHSGSAIAHSLDEGSIDQAMDRYFEKCEQAALDKVVKVLPLTPQGLFVEHSTVYRALHGDYGTVRTVLKAGTPMQVYKALGMALMTMGDKFTGCGLMRAAQTLGDDQDDAKETVDMDGTTGSRPPYLKSPKSTPTEVKSEDDAGSRGP